MSKEIAKKLIAELQTNEDLKAKIAGITDPAEMAKKSVEAGYDVTLAELVEAEKEYRAETAKKSDELSADELEGAAGGGFWHGENNKDEKNTAVISVISTKNIREQTVNFASMITIVNKPMLMEKTRYV